MISLIFAALVGATYPCHIAHFDGDYLPDSMFDHRTALMHHDGEGGHIYTQIVGGKRVVYRQTECPIIDHFVLDNGDTIWAEEIIRGLFEGAPPDTIGYWLDRRGTLEHADTIWVMRKGGDTR